MEVKYIRRKIIMLVRCSCCQQEEHAKAGYVCYGNKWFHPQCWKDTQIQMEVIAAST